MNQAAERRVVVITGGSGMLGTAITERLITEGYDVVVLYRRSAPAQREHLFPYECDITDKGTVHAALEKAVSEVGIPSAGIHCAHAPITRKKITDIDIQTLHAQFDTGVFGGFIFFKEIAQYLKKQGSGVLIGITTAAVDSEESMGSVGGYLAAKHALKGLLLELRHDLEPQGIHVFEVAPGFMEGGLNADLPPRLIEFMKEKGGVLAKPEDVAAAVAGLL